VDGPSLCRMFNEAIAGQSLPVRLSVDHDPLSLVGVTPAEKSGGESNEAAKLDCYRWESCCRGLFELPAAA
jgi:hypothetical protein